MFSLQVCRLSLRSFVFLMRATGTVYLSLFDLTTEMFIEEYKI